MLYVVISFILVIIDQIIKYFVVLKIPEHGGVKVIDGLLTLTYVKNYGIAFGMFQNKVMFFIIITSVVAAIIAILIYKFKDKHRPATLCLTLIFGGAVGNIVDRIRLGYVVDYFSVSFFPPIFNFADSCVVVGAFILCLYVLFDKDLLEEERV